MKISKQCNTFSTTVSIHIQHKTYIYWPRLTHNDNYIEEISYLRDTSKWQRLNSSFYLFVAYFEECNIRLQNFNISKIISSKLIFYYKAIYVMTLNSRAWNQISVVPFNTYKEFDRWNGSSWCNMWCLRHQTTRAISVINIITTSEE